MLNMRMKSFKLDYRQEYFFRVLDYFLYQFMGSLTDSNPYEDLYNRIVSHLESQIDDGRRHGASVDSKDLFNKNYKDDMRWEQQATGLNITIENPLIILKDRQYLAECFRLDLGKIKITNTTQESKERWMSDP